MTNHSCSSNQTYSAGTICHVRRSAWPGPTIRKRTHPSCYQSATLHRYFITGSRAECTGKWV